MHRHGVVTIAAWLTMRNLAADIDPTRCRILWCRDLPEAVIAFPFPQSRTTSVVFDNGRVVVQHRDAAYAQLGRVERCQSDL
jgi:hypothetical protein